MFWHILGLLVSIGLIIGGLSGDLVLRGTNSSEALVIAGVVFLIFDIYRIVKYKKFKAATETPVIEADIPPEERLSAPCNVRFTRQSSIVGGAVSYQIILNNKKVSGVKSGQNVTFPTDVIHNSVKVADNAGNYFPGEYKFEAAPGGTVDIRWNRKFL